MGKRFLEKKQTKPLKNQYNANTKFVSIWSQPINLKRAHSVHSTATAVCYPAMNVEQPFGKLREFALGFCVFWPDNALGFGTRVRTFGALLSSLDLKNSSQTSYHKSFCSKSWHPYGSAIGSSHAMVSQCQLLSSPNSKQNTAVKIPPLCCHCSFTQAV